MSKYIFPNSKQHLFVTKLDINTLMYGEISLALIINNQVYVYDNAMPNLKRFQCRPLFLLKLSIF